MFLRFGFIPRKVHRVKPTVEKLALKWTFIILGTFAPILCCWEDRKMQKRFLGRWMMTGCDCTLVPFRRRPQLCRMSPESGAINSARIVKVKQLWVRIPAQETRWTFFDAKLYYKRPTINEKETGDSPFLEKLHQSWHFFKKLINHYQFHV